MKNNLGCILVGLVFVAIIALTACAGLLVDEDVAVKTLETQGFSNIEIVQRDWLFVPIRGGSEKDNARFKCLATNPAGDNVTVYVYAGWPFKGGTIRTP